MLSPSEKLCKFSLLALFPISIILAIRTILRHDLIYAVYDIDAILFFLLCFTVVQGIIGIVGWILIHFENEKGKSLIIITFGISFGLYALICLFLLITILFPNFFVVSPFSIVTIFFLCLSSGAVLLLQHFWTRYVL